MTGFTIHNRDTAPEATHDIMDAYADRLGFVPNLVGILANSPAVLKSYATGYQMLSETAFSPAEQQLLLLTVSRANGCRYCVAAHSLAGKMAGLDEETVHAVRDGRPVLDPKLAAISEFATKVVDKRGHVSPMDIETFLTAGHTRAQVMEVLLAVSVKTISNYMNHIAQTPLDEAMSAMAWTPNPAESAAE